MGVDEAPTMFLALANGENYFSSNGDASDISLLILFLLL